VRIAIGVGRVMRENIHSQAPIRRDSLTLLDSLAGIPPLDDHLFAGRKAGTRGDEVGSVVRDKLQLDGA
jgi:hypothetical protein